ncbi:MAG: armadillo-type protein [Benjaminiella poitrasii]|nr:MAG: armadillo-type protein [Benjaminiella poitrasii]
MNVQTISQIEKLIQKLYSNADSLVAVQIQNQLQEIQRQPFAWELASQLLSSQSDQCRFFGAHTFQVKITRDWETLPEDRIDWLREELLGWIVRLCGGPHFIITKLCIALISYAFHTVPDKWPNFITTTLEAITVGSQNYNISSDTVNITLLEFLTLVPEEVSNSNLMGGRKLQLIGELKGNIPMVLSSLSNFLLFSSTNTIQIQQKSLRCLQSWIQYGFQLEDAYSLMEKVMSLLLTNEDLFESAVEVLIESMQQPTWNKYQTYRQQLFACLTSDVIQAKFNACLADEDEEVARLLAKLMAVFGETYTDFIVGQLADPQMQKLMQMMLRLTGFEGYFPVDQEVSEIPLNFWYIMQETLFDESVLPLQRDNEWLLQCGQTAVAIYRELVTILVKVACYPDEDTWISWNKDIKDKFKIWRRDLGDTMINPYYVLREEMLAILLDQVVSVISQWTSLPTASQHLEATLFSLKSITEEVSPEENVHIARLFGPDVLGRLPDNCGSRLKNTILLLIGSLSEWLRKHPEFLSSVMNYIVPCLSNPQLALSASSAFSDICDTCRESLVNELQSLMHVYGAMVNSNIKSNIMQKVVESVADVIQVLPPDRAMAPLMSLTGDILQGISKALTIKEPEVARDSALVQIQYLTACCRGIQSPNDEYQSLNERQTVYDAFASGQLAALYSTMEGFGEVTYAIQASMTEIAHAWAIDEQIAKAMATFLEQGIRSTSPLLSLSFLDLISLVESSYYTAPFSCWLNTAAFMMTVFGGQQAFHIEKLRDFLGNLTKKTLEMIRDAEVMEHHPDIVDSYFGLLSRTIVRCPLAFYQLPIEMINTIFMFVIAGMQLQERLALKAALNFMADFVSQDHQENTKVVDSIMMNLGPQIMEKLLLGIGGRVPRSFSGPLIDVLYKITGKYMQESRQWMQTLLANDGFPTVLVNANDKETFLKGVLGTRSLKRFKETTNNFSIKCRGLGNTTFGKV